MLTPLTNPAVSRRPPRSVIALVCAAVLSAGCSMLAAADPNALWQIVNFDCVPAARTAHGTGVCTSVNLPGRYALLRDRNGAAQHLLIPTDRISGIESPRLLRPDAPNYWADAWQARRFVEATLEKARRASLPDDRIGLEINSAMRRSQEQLHIHIDCVRDDVTSLLARHRSDPPDRWVWETIDGVRYRIMRMPGPAFDFNPFDLVADGTASPDLMAQHTIFVTGAASSTARAGWLVLDSSLDIDGGTGSAETLLDHRCAAAGPM